MSTFVASSVSVVFTSSETFGNALSAKRFVISCVVSTQSRIRTGMPQSPGSGNAEARRVMVRTFSRPRPNVQLAILDWLDNKINSIFAVPALCQPKCFIPLDIWKAGDRNDNLIETTHADVNREGYSCSLVSGVEKGRRYDLMKSAGLRVCLHS